MKKLILILLLSIVLYSCKSLAPKPGEQYQNGPNYNTQLRYFKDSKTNNCLIERGVSSTYSFTCVECDSLFEKAYIEQFNK